MKETCAIGIDVGGTKIAAGFIKLPGRPSRGRVISTNAQRGGRAVLDDVLELARELAQEIRQSGCSVSALGVGICELVDCSGHLASGHCIPWLELPIAEELSTIAPVFFEADVRAAAVAECALGAGRPFNNFLYVTIGTGISCCLVLEGQPYLGARGLTGTMASSALAICCEQCGHTTRLTLEEMASGPGLVARSQAAGGSAATAYEVLAAAADGNQVAQQVVTAACETLGAHLGLLVNTLDPEALVIGGGLGLSEGAYGDRLIASTRAHIWSRLNRDLPVLRAETGADAGWIGAALCAARKVQQNQVIIS
jgi:glucokinase